MDIDQLAEVLRATLQPAQREQAEQQLNEVSDVKQILHTRFPKWLPCTCARDGKFSFFEQY